MNFHKIFKHATWVLPAVFLLALILMYHQIVEPQLLCRIHIQSVNQSTNKLFYSNSYMRVFSMPYGQTPPLETNLQKQMIKNLDEFNDWVTKKPEAALAWAKQQPDSTMRQKMLAAICYHFAVNDPARAVALAEKFNLQNAGNNTNAILANLAQQWAMKDLTAAYDWGMQQPAGNQRDLLLQSIALIWSQSEPASAANFVVEQIPPGGVQTETVMSVLHQWAMTDFSGAYGWVKLFPEGLLRERAVAELNGIAQWQLSVGLAKVGSSN